MMKDSDLRGLVLRQLYDVRHQHHFLRIPDELSVPGLNMNSHENLTIVGNISDQLAQQKLIEWHQVISPYPSGQARITAFGVDVVEGTAPAPISISIDQSINVHNSSGVQIGKGNVQNVSGVEHINIAIDQSNATQNEKAQAKSLFDQILKNKLLLAVLNKFGLNMG